MNPKAALLERIRNELREQLERLTQAARDAHAAATDPGSKAEGKYDTRSLEASYLAAGQARQVEDAADALTHFSNITFPEFDITDPIDAGALVEADLNDETVHFLLAPASGGLILEHEGLEITLLTPASNLYRQLLGKRVGDSLSDPPLMVTEVS